MDAYPSDPSDAYPYSLNERVGDEYMTEKDRRVVGNKFLPLDRLYKRPEYNYSKNKLDNSFLKQNFVKILTTHLDHNLKDAGYLFVFPSNLLKSLS